MNEQLAAIIDLLKTAIGAGQTVSLSADDVTVKSGPSTDGTVGQVSFEVTINNPSVITEA